jgi:small neutral amino acid transporter SnatA (MarC family)
VKAAGNPNSETKGPPTTAANGSKATSIPRAPLVAGARTIVAWLVLAKQHATAAMTVNVFIRFMIFLMFTAFFF